MTVYEVQAGNGLQDFLKLDEISFHSSVGVAAMTPSKTAKFGSRRLKREQGCARDERRK